MTFWGTDLGGSTTTEPKRRYKFIVEFGTAGRLLATKSIQKPTATFQNKEYRMINHYFNYPGLVQWDAIELSLVDFDYFGASGKNKDLGYSSNNTGSRLWNMLLASGYSTPSGKINRAANSDGLSSPSKQLMSNAFGEIIIYQIDSGGLNETGKQTVKYLEKWTLKNPIIEKISWGELSYSDEELVQCDMTIKFDWPEYEQGPKILKL